MKISSIRMEGFMQDIFSNLSSEAVEQLKNVWQLRSFKTADTFFLQGDAPGAMYFILDGRVKIARVNPEGNETILCIRSSRDVFCPIPILDSREELGTATALTDGKLFWVNKDVFLQLCDQYPELHSLVQKDCLMEVRRLLERMESYAYRSIRERLAFSLVEAMDQNVDQGKPAYIIRLKQTDLAGLVGASRESVSRTLSEFEDQGMVVTARGKIQILDREKLMLIANLPSK